AAVLTLAPGVPAVAAPPSPPSPQPSQSAPAAGSASGSQRATFGIRPSGANGPDNRPVFTYGATPGAAVTGPTQVSNASEGPLPLRVYASDAFNPRAGGFDLLAAGKKPVDVGAWVKVDQENVTVPGRGRSIVPFTLTIPANATPGDHAGGIVASLTTLQTNAKGDKVSVDQRVGARIY